MVVTPSRLSVVYWAMVVTLTIFTPECGLLGNGGNVDNLSVVYWACLRVVYWAMVVTLTIFTPQCGLLGNGGNVDNLHA